MKLEKSSRHFIFSVKKWLQGNSDSNMYILYAIMLKIQVWYAIIAIIYLLKSWYTASTSSIHTALTAKQESH